MRGKCDEDPAALWAELVEELKTLAAAARHVAAAIEKTPDETKPKTFGRFLYHALANDIRDMNGRLLKWPPPSRQICLGRGDGGA